MELNGLYVNQEKWRGALKRMEVERKKIASKYSDMWGKKWFVITNPMYGRWEYSIYNNESPESEEAATAIRINSLRP